LYTRSFTHSPEQIFSQKRSGVRKDNTKHLIQPQHTLIRAQRAVLALCKHIDGSADWTEKKERVRKNPSGSKI
jgi:hypothetical protein